MVHLSAKNKITRIDKKSFRSIYSNYASSFDNYLIKIVNFQVTIGASKVLALNYSSSFAVFLQVL